MANSPHPDMLALCQHVWGRLGPQKYVVGRTRVDRMTRDAVRLWPLYPEAVDSQDEVRNLVLSEAAASSGRQTYGVIWMLILSAVIGQIIRVLVDWWLESRDNRQTFIHMRILEEQSQ
jgi:hypothetical protein